MSPKSEFEIPLFIFLALVLLSLPGIPLAIIIYQRQRQQRGRQRLREEATFTSQSLPQWREQIDLDHIRVSPATVPPIRSLQHQKRQLPLPLVLRRADGKFVAPANNSQRRSSIPVPHPQNIDRGEAQIQPKKDIAATKLRDQLRLFAGVEDPAETRTLTTQFATFPKIPPIALLHPPPKRAKRAPRMRGVQEGKAQVGAAPRVKSQKVRFDAATVADINDAPMPEAEDGLAQEAKEWV